MILNCRNLLNLTRPFKGGTEFICEIDSIGKYVSSKIDSTILIMQQNRHKFYDIKRSINRIDLTCKSMTAKELQSEISSLGCKIEIKN